MYTPRSKLAAIVLALLIAAAPASASLLPTEDDNISIPPIQIPGTEITLPGGDLNQYFEELRSWAIAKITNIVSHLDPRLASIVSDYLGKLGLPASEEIETKVAEEVENNTTPNPFGVNPTVMGSHIGQSTSQTVQKAQVESVLGKANQENLAQEISRITQLNNSVAEASARASSTNISQEIMHELAKQNVDIASILGAVHQENLQTRLATTANTEALVNMNSNLSQKDLEKKIALAADRSGLFTTVTQFSTFMEQ
jgi:hypothetical protein